MPTKRRSGGPAAKAKSQSTLAFHGQTSKITKAHVQPPSTKAHKEPVVEDLTSDVESKDESKTTLEDPEEEEVASVVVDAPEPEAVPQLSPEEEEANQITQAQIRKYWSAKEEIRKAPRVHQESLSLEEKICREWDTNVQFGVSLKPPPR